MPTQLLSRDYIRERWGGRLRGFEPAPPGHPIAAGMPAGAITDDTEQAVLLGRLLVIRSGAVNPRELAEALVSWERDMAARGSLDLLGPSTKRAVAAVLAGTPPEQAGGPALATPTVPPCASPRSESPSPSRLPGLPGTPAPDMSVSTLVDRVVAASGVTHDTGLALAGAAAVAAAVSAGVAGAGVREATALAVRAARLAAVENAPPVLQVAVLDVGILALDRFLGDRCRRLAIVGPGSQAVCNPAPQGASRDAAAYQQGRYQTACHRKPSQQAGTTPAVGIVTEAGSPCHVSFPPVALFRISGTRRSPPINQTQSLQREISARAQGKLRRIARGYIWSNAG